MRLSAVAGNPLIGLYAKVSEEFAVVGVRDRKFREAITEELKVDTIHTTIAGSELVGALLALNSSGAVVSSNALSKEIETLKRQLEVEVLDTPMTCFGNNFCLNDFGGIANPEVSDGVVEKVSKFLEVEIVKGTIGGIKAVGMAAVITNKGGLAHPRLTDWEKKKIEKVMKVEVLTGTVNFGIDMVGAGVLANSKGCVVGKDTTGFELGVVMDALFPR
ncbi:MAG: translation initiation factor IF-6 [Archaeoglobaceae archaeon]|nr:translation initiation factor IF-6 [Archaeoglobaceae archaeon]MCX8152326.1 translation initiation factor IF-6 [Archaeoglobaceae archaeon]MDW8013646.1 translation initiation factor IF-6 [Archaeoglobaceae archaeon]